MALDWDKIKADAKRRDAEREKRNREFRPPELKTPDITPLWNAMQKREVRPAIGLPQRDYKPKLPVGGIPQINTGRNTFENALFEIGQGMAPKDPNSWGGFMQYNLARAAQGTAAAIELPLDFAVGGLNKLGSTIASGFGTNPNAVSKWFDEGAQFVLDNDISGSIGQGIEEKTDGKASKLGRFAGDLYEMAPGVIGSVSGGKLLGGDKLSKLLGADKNGNILKTMSGQREANAAKLMLSAQAAGGGAQQAFNEGATVEQAQLFGSAVGALEIATEGIAGGIPGLGKGLTGKLIGKIKKVPGAAKGLVEMIGEGGEEVLTSFVTPYLQRAIYNPEAENATLEELAQAFVGGAALSGIMQGANALGNGRKAKTAGTTASGTLGATSTDTQGVVSDVLKTPERAVEGAGDVGAPVEGETAQGGIENASTGEAGMSLLIPEQSAVAAGQGLPVRVDGAVYKVVEIPQAKIDEISEYIDNNTTPSVKVKYKRIIKNLFMGQKFTNVNTIAKNVAYEIGIGSKGIGEIIARQPVNAETLAMLEQLNEIVENAKFVASEPSTHGGDRIIRSDLFETDTMAGDKPGIARMRVNVSDNGNNLYYVTNKITEGDTPQPRGDQSQHRGVEGAPTATNSIPQTPENSNMKLPQNTTLPDGTGAAEAGFDPFSHLQNQKGEFHKTGEEPTRIVEVPTTDEQGRNISKGVQTALEAGATPDAAVDKIQNSIAEGKFSYLPVTDSAAKGRAEETIRYKGFETALRDWTADARGGKVSKDLLVLGQTLYNNALNSGHTKEGVDILVDLVKMSRTGAQTTQANRVLKQLSPDYQLYALQRSVMRLEDEIRGRLKKQGFEGITLDQTLLQEYHDASTEAERDGVMEKLKDDIASQVPSTWHDKWNAWRFVAMLGNLKTHIRNFVGNAGFVPVRMVKNAIAIGLENAAGVENRTKAVLSIKDIPLVKTAFADYDAVSEQIMSLGKFDNFAGDIESRRTIFKGKNGTNIVWKFLEGIKNFNSKALDFGDVIFAKPAYATSLAGFYKANGISAEQLASGSVPLETIDSARAYAIREAQRATYRDSNAFSDFVAKLGKQHSDNPFAKAANVLVEGVLPFKRTPANILTRAVEYSPAGLLKGLTNDLIKVHRGDMDAATAIDNITAGLTGSGILAFGAFLASMGLISGGRSDDDKEATLDDLTGFQEYALKVGGKSITLDWLAPEALPFFVGVELFNAASDKSKEGMTFTKVLNKLSNIAEPMLEMSMLQGVQAVIDSVKYSDGSIVVGIVATSAVNYLTQGLPTLFGQAERIAEKERETTYIDNTSGIPASIQRMLGKTANKIPFVEYNQAPYVDAFGRHQDSGSLGKKIFDNAINPAYVKNKNSDAVTDELYRLNDAKRLDRVPDKPERKFSYGGKEYILTAEEYAKFSETSGAMTHKLMQTMLDKNAYDKANDEGKAKMLSYIIGYADDAAKREYVEGIGKTYTSSDYQKAYDAYNAGIAVPDYYFFNNTLDGIKANDNPTQLEAAKVAMDAELENSYKGKLWDLQNKQWAGGDKNPFTGALAKSGIPPKVSIGIMEKYKELENTEFTGKSSQQDRQRATEIEMYIAGLGLAPEQAEIAKEVYRYWGSYPVKAYK